MKKLRDRGDALGRIVDVSDDGKSYVVEWLVLGGTTTGVAHYYLYETSPADEGLTTTRRREKRKPPCFADEAIAMDTAKAAKRAAAMKAKAESKAKALEMKKAKTATEAKSAVSKKTQTVEAKRTKATEPKKKPADKKETIVAENKKATIKKPATKSKELVKKADTKKKAPQPATKKAPAAKRKAPAEPTQAGKKRKLTPEKPTTAALEPPAEKVKANEDVVPKGMDLYEKHRREFDRIMARLEKIDPFGWFWDPVPPEYEENYGKVEGPLDGASGQAATGDTDADVDDACDDGLKKKAQPYFDRAPYNWEMIRRRKAHGRYELDRTVIEEDEYLSMMMPYYSSTGRQLPRKTKKSAKSLLKQTPTARVLYPVGVHWELFSEDVSAMIDAACERAEDPTMGGRTSIEVAAKKLREALEQTVGRTGRRQDKEMRFYDDRHRFDKILRHQSNMEAAMQSWRRFPFPERRYERLTSDVVSAGLSELDERTATYELKTSLPDSFIGMSYRYDDTGQSEAWMQSVVEEAEAKGEAKGTNKAKQAAMALAADQGVVRAQVVATMQSLLIGVQDRVMTEMSVLHQPELRSANWVESEDLDLEADQKDQDAIDNKFRPQIVEQPVWGIDCYTRQNLLICLQSEFDPETSLTFVEKWLLPAINACPPDIAHDISNAARILEGLPFEMPSEEDRLEKLAAEDESDSKAVQQWSHTLLGNALVEKIKSHAPPWLNAAANLLRRARVSLGPNFFRVHPKGHGSVVLSPLLEPNRLVTFYRGEIYPSWRWGEKMDAIEITQQRKGLRPTLPDFYNMALERPQMDPRGYGLLFVDASRKAGHGSSLSHSCQPTCEVRVSAMNGELCLTMTTLRELEMGEELTFDYNAATDSFDEYYTAVCLCGHGKCRGSFLHYATAECYQKVMNRNCPIASRFSNLIKGCMKQVMSEDDQKVLGNHGFRTAAFGAISINRRDGDSVNQHLSDTMDIVPVWLKTYAADTLRYIEYERRALPITLVCDQMSPDTTTSKEEEKNDEPSKAKAAKEPTRPESSFFFFARRQSERIGKILKDKGFDKTGLELQTAKQKVAAAYWNSLSDEKKEFWKQESAKEFEKKKKEWKAQQAKERKKANAKKLPPTETKTTPEEKEKSGPISFQDADAEGVSAMEHRIQHLTQALSRVGRVLDRHREGYLQQQNSSGLEDSSLRDVVHSPLKVLADAEVVNRLWFDKDGVVKSLTRFIESSGCVSGDLRADFSEVILKYDPSLRDRADRETLKSALLELRGVISTNLQKMLKEFRKYKAQTSSEKGSTPDPSDAKEDTSVTPRQDADDEIMEDHDVIWKDDNTRDVTHMVRNSLSKESVPDSDIRSEVRLILNGMVDKAVELVEGNAANQKYASLPQYEKAESNVTANGDLGTHSWIDHFGERVALEAAADLLLLYAHTSNFFVINSYATLESTPIEVYARELGNAVPRTAIDQDLVPSTNAPTEETDGHVEETKAPRMNKNKSGQTDENSLCSPDDVVAKVSVKYGGEYVVSQLLQWYNGGIGQKPGLPDLSGCVALPPISGCWTSSILPKKKIISDRKTVYDTRIRQQLVEWLQDPFKRGDPFPESIRQAFYGNNCDERPVERILFGSPVLDFLVMGDESNIFEALEGLDVENRVSSRRDDTLSTVDKGRPAQAVCRWVQCENPDCLKWRKIPWHVDIDLLPEVFFCADNKWDPERTSCDIPEDNWDADDKLVGSDGKVEGSPIRKKGPASPSKETSFRVGAKFDVQRTVKGKNKFSVATVTHIDFSGKTKRVKFHYQKTSSDADEWVQFGSDRIATLHSKTGDSVKKEQNQMIKADKSTDTSNGAEKVTKEGKQSKNSKDGKLSKRKISKKSDASDKEQTEIKNDTKESRDTLKEGKDATKDNKKSKDGQRKKKKIKDGLQPDGKSTGTESTEFQSNENGAGTMFVDCETKPGVKISKDGILKKKKKNSKHKIDKAGRLPAFKIKGKESVEIRSNEGLIGSEFMVCDTAPVSLIKGSSEGKKEMGLKLKKRKKIDAAEPAGSTKNIPKLNADSVVVDSSGWAQSSSNSPETAPLERKHKNPRPLETTSFKQAHGPQVREKTKPIESKSLESMHNLGAHEKVHSLETKTSGLIKEEHEQEKVESTGSKSLESMQDIQEPEKSCVSESGFHKGGSVASSKHEALKDPINTNTSATDHKTVVLPGQSKAVYGKKHDSIVSDVSIRQHSLGASQEVVQGTPVPVAVARKERPSHDATNTNPDSDFSGYVQSYHIMSGTSPLPGRHAQDVPSIVVGAKTSSDGSSSTPSARSGPRQVTAEKPSPDVSQGLATSETVAQSPSLVHANRVLGGMVGEQMTAPQADRQGQYFHPDVSAFHSGPVNSSSSSRTDFSSDPLLSAIAHQAMQLRNQNSSQNQPLDQLLGDNPLEELARRFQQPPPPPPAMSNLEILTALAMANNQQNSYSSSMPSINDLQHLVQQSGGDPALLMQLHQLLQNSQLHRN